jgi:hypothetical protein
MFNPGYILLYVQSPETSRHFYAPLRERDNGTKRTKKWRYVRLSGSS